MGKIGFGMLHALNHETLSPGTGIPLHAHENMEIISLPLTGVLRHQDSRGVIHVISPGDIHVLSAGLGITHWEFNNSGTQPAHYLQVWISPQARLTPTSYAQTTFGSAIMGNLTLIAAPAEHAGAVTIKQNAYLSLARLAPGVSLEYRKYRSENGVYVFLIEGRLRIGSSELRNGGGMGITEATLPDLLAVDHCYLLCIEVPMQQQAENEPRQTI